MKNSFVWWYNPVFLFAELIQAAIGILTLTTYQPCLTTAFAVWHYKYKTNKEMEQEYGNA